MATLCNRCRNSILQLWLLSFFFLSSPILSGHKVDVYHTSTHDVALVRIWNAGLNVPRAARWKYRMQKNRHLRTIAQICWAISSQLRHVSTIRKKLVKHQYLLYVSSQYGELPPTNGRDRLASLGHPSKFQRVSRLGFLTAPTSLNGRQPNFAWSLAISWTGTLCIHFLGLLPPTDYCQVQNSLCIQVLHSPILAALLHGSRAVGVSQTLGHSAQGIIFVRIAITLVIGPHSSSLMFSLMVLWSLLHWLPINFWAQVNVLYHTASQCSHYNT